MFERTLRFCFTKTKLASFYDRPSSENVKNIRTKAYLPSYTPPHSIVHVFQPKIWRWEVGRFSDSETPRAKDISRNVSKPKMGLSRNFWKPKGSFRAFFSNSPAAPSRDWTALTLCACPLHHPRPPTRIPSFSPALPHAHARLL